MELLEGVDREETDQATIYERRIFLKGANHRDNG